MPNTARVLRFPGTPVRSTGLTTEAAKDLAKEYFSKSVSDRGTEASRHALFSDNEFLFALSSLLREKREAYPREVAAEAEYAYCWIEKSTEAVGLFDEREYLLGEIALQAGTAHRLLGNFDLADRWFERAEAGFRHTLDPAPQLANLAYGRLTLRYAKGCYAEVIELLPSVCKSFRKLAMHKEAAKGILLEALSLKALGKIGNAIPLLQALVDDAGAREDCAVLGQAYLNLGSCYTDAGQYSDALMAYQAAAGPIEQSERPMLVAELKWTVGDTYRSLGQSSEALEAYRSARTDYDSLGMRTFAVMLRLVTAESLLALNRSREAEWELLAALPTIEEQKMVPEGFAAVALLKESVRRRKTDPNALRELREHLQASK